MIRIGLDARMVRPIVTGLGRYARALCLELTGREAPGVTWVIIKNRAMADSPLASPGARVEEVVVDGCLDRPANLLRAPAIECLKLDLYHALHHFLPLGLRVPHVVMTLHDLIWVEYAHLTFDTRFASLRSRVTGVWGKATMRHALNRADAVIAISEATRQAALRRYPALDAGRVTTVHHGVDRALFSPGERPEPARPYFFSLGNSKPYKNVRRVLDAFALVAAGDPEPTLILTGRGDGNDHLGRRAAELGIADRVRFTGMLPDADVAALFQGARALVFPSLVEGFGFPLVEAMALGCPVVASAVPALEEICAGAAVYADPLRTDEIARAMRRVLSDSNLRARLRQRGLLRAEAFTWSRCADQTWSVYARLLGLAA